jgi:hypothetical protein
VRQHQRRGAQGIEVGDYEGGLKVLSGVVHFLRDCAGA